MKGVAVIFLAAFAASHANQCPAEQATNWEIELLLPHEDCNKFYKCTYGQPVAQDCFGDLLYNVNTQTCDWDYNVDCGDRNRPGDSAVPQPDPEPESEAQTDAPIQTEPEVESLPVTQPTTAVPEIVTEPEVELQTSTVLPTDIQTEPEVESLPVTQPTTAVPEIVTEPEVELQTSTVLPTDAPEAQPEPEVEPVQPEPEDPEIEFQENGCPVDPFIHWLFPSSEDCNVFYQCVWGKPVEMKCSSTLHFNPVLQVCDWPHDAGCAV